MAGSLDLNPNSPTYGQLVGVSAGQTINLDKNSPQYGVVTTSAMQTTPPTSVPGATQTVDQSSGMVQGANTELQNTINSLTPQQTETEKKQQTILDQMTSLAGNYANKSADQLAAEQAAGIPEQNKQFAELNKQILAKTAEYNAMQTQYEKASAALEGQGRGITTSIITGQQGAIARQAAAEKNAKAAEIGLLQAQAQGLQGQITQAQNTVNRAIDLKYSTIEAQQKLYEAQLNAIIPTLNKEEKTRALAQQTLLEQEKQKIADQKALDKQNTNFVLDLASKYPDAGISVADTPEQAQSKVSKSRIYQQATRLAGGGSGTGSGSQISSQPTGQITDNGNGTYTYINRDGSTHTGLFGDNYVDNTQSQEQFNLPTINGKARNDTQNIALGYATRTSEADKILNELGSKFTGALSYISGSNLFPNILKTADRQRFEQAERNFVNAVLRKESGAAISPSEFDNAAKQYFPQPGDSKEVVAQKAKNRQTVINSLYQASNTYAPNESGSSSYSDYLKAIQ